MGLKKSTEKLNNYFGRLRQEKTQKIKPSHVEKVLTKLRAKESDLLEEIEKSHKESKTERLKSKLRVVREQINRGEWLMQEISDAS